MSAAHIKRDNGGGWGTPFSVVLSFLTILIVLLVVISFVAGWIMYAQNTFIDFQRNLAHPEDIKGILILFIIPIVLQSAGLIAMFCRFHKDKSLTTHYAFCIIIMSSCPSSYCLLWICYMSEWYSWATLSYLALGAIIFLLLPVILMTYAILWTPGRDSLAGASQLNEDDIKDWTNFCKELKRDGANFGGYPKRIFERLPYDLRVRLKDARNDADYDAIEKPALIEALNSALKDKYLYLAVNIDNSDIGGEARELLFQGQKNLTEGEVQRLNRLLLEGCCRGALKPLAPISRGRNFIRKWERFLFNIKEGITKAHFWVLANFFAVFLGVTYLFGFAFAFHDQRAIEDKKEPDLFMAKTTPSKAGAQQLENHIAPTEPDARVARYVFYFDSLSAHPNISEHLAFNDTVFIPDSNSPDKSKEWKKNVNYSRLERISDDILKLTEHGERLRVELVGSTDYCDLQAAPYSSNYELSEARAQNIKYILLKRISEKDKRQRNIEWLYLPASSEGSPLSPMAEDKAANVKCTDVQQQIKSPPKVKPDMTSVVKWLEDKKKALFEDRRLTAQVSELSEDINNLEAVVETHKLTKEALKEPMDRLDFLVNATAALTEATTNKRADKKRLEELDKDVRRRRVEFQESFNAFDYVDESGGKRIVVVSLIPVRDSQWFVPLSLMDYMYFSIYTITTTGYGDIIPTTAFSKFLCSFSNILEVFFLVVFFNALLSVKGEKRLSRATDKK